MSKGSCVAAESAVGAALRMARAERFFKAEHHFKAERAIADAVALFLRKLFSK